MYFGSQKRKMTWTSSDLHVAIHTSQIGVIKQCVKNQNIINSYWRGCTPVSSAIYLKRYIILRILVKNGANVNLISRNNKMEPPLFAACRLHDILAINILLRAPGLDIEQRDFFGRTALWAAARYCNVEVVELLLNEGANLNNKLCSSHPIIAAYDRNSRNSRAIIQVFIRTGCVLDAELEKLLLQWALRHADRETFCLLISAGCKVKYVEDWLCDDKLPNSWKEDKSFYNWVVSLRANPLSLFTLTACFIRSLLIAKWDRLTPFYVDKLQLPNSLNNLLLFRQ